MPTQDKSASASPMISAIHTRTAGQKVRVIVSGFPVDRSGSAEQGGDGCVCVGGGGGGRGGLGERGVDQENINIFIMTFYVHKNMSSL